MEKGKENIIEKVEGEIVAETEEMENPVMEFRLINPTEDGFLQVIKWNKEELEAAVCQKMVAYENVIYTEENIQQAKVDRAELNNLVKAIEERRKRVKAALNAPYEVFEKEVKGILKMIQKPIEMIDNQIKCFENQQKEEKCKTLHDIWEKAVGDMADILPFDKVFEQRYLNKTYKLNDAKKEITEKINIFIRDLEIIDSLESQYKLNAKDVYIKTQNLSKALAENKRLVDLEQRIEVNCKKKEKGECHKEEEHKVIIKEQEEKELQVTEEKAEQIKPTISSEMTEEKESTSVLVMGQSVECQTFTTAIDPFAVTPKQEEKRFRTKFWAVGTRTQLEKLIEFMKQNNIEYGRMV